MSLEGEMMSGDELKGLKNGSSSSNDRNGSLMWKLSEEEEKLMSELKEELGQQHLFEVSRSPSELKEFCQNVLAFASSYPGGIRRYQQNAKRLLKEAIDGVNPFLNFSVEVPDCVELKTSSEIYQNFEKTGLNELKNCAFVLVAGGLGERLGFPHIKISIPVEISTMTSYLQLYTSYLTAYQTYFANTTGENIKIPLAIMTSDDTHDNTAHLLHTHNYFGLDQQQITLMKQERVPVLINNNADFIVDPTNNTKLASKPHGHGDVHSLLLKHGLPQKWQSEGRQWILFFQDTNSLIFRSLPALVGVSVAKNFAMNTIVVPRFPGDAVGAICRLVSQDTNQSLTTNVEYNLLGSLLKNMGNQSDSVNEHGYSKYPGNTNIILFNTRSYLNALLSTGGSMPEFINPKYKDESKAEFKNPTRLEAMMQDFAKLIDSADKIGCTMFDRWICFSPLKNNLSDAAIRFAKHINPECGISAEMDEYEAAGKMMEIAAQKSGAVFDVRRQKEKSSRLLTFGGVTYERQMPKIVAKPTWGISIQQMASRLQQGGNISITDRSTLIIEGNVYIKNLSLDGALILKAVGDGQLIVENLTVKNDGWKFVELSQMEAETKPELAIRGYKLQKLDTVEYIAADGEKKVISDV